MLHPVGNVSLPTPVFLAGGALCLVAGYFAGTVTGPGTPARTTAQVVSFDAATEKLCLQGDAIKDQDGVDSSGHLCGTLRRAPSSRVPAKGDDFRFVSVESSGEVDGRAKQQVVIYGAVVN
jgi:hypothetical protein